MVSIIRNRFYDELNVGMLTEEKLRNLERCLALSKLSEEDKEYCRFNLYVDDGLSLAEIAARYRDDVGARSILFCLRGLINNYSGNITEEKRRLLQERYESAEEQILRILGGQR